MTKALAILTLVAAVIFTGPVFAQKTESPLLKLPGIKQQQEPAPAPNTLQDPLEDEVAPKSNEAVAPAKPAKPAFELAKDLDGLFEQLARTADERRAKLISQRVWELWQTSDDRSIDLLTHWARNALSKKNYVAALDLLDQVVVLKPGYAEGWNQRATLHFQMRNYGRSIADIERTLALEPRHFGALAGLASIQQILERKDQALKTWYRALAVYPAMKSAQDAVIRLEEELAGSAI